MDISNLEKTRSRRDYNRYEVGYGSVRHGISIRIPDVGADGVYCSGAACD